MGQHHLGELRLETAQAKAERIITEELGCLQWPQPKLASRRNHDPGKRETVGRLRRKTTLSIKHIAARLHLGSPRSASVRSLTGTGQKACGEPARLAYQTPNREFDDLERHCARLPKRRPRE